MQDFGRPTILYNYIRLKAKFREKWEMYTQLKQCFDRTLAWRKLRPRKFSYIEIYIGEWRRIETRRVSTYVDIFGDTRSAYFYYYFNTFPSSIMKTNLHNTHQ